MLDEATRQRIMLHQEGAILASISTYGGHSTTCEVARCQIDGIANALIRMEGAKEAAHFVFALSDRVAGGVRDSTDYVSQVVICEQESPPPVLLATPTGRVTEFAYGFISGLAAMWMLIAFLAGRL